MEKKQTKNEFLGYTIENNQVVLEWNLLPHQSFTNFKRVAVSKMKKILIELLNKNLISHEFWSPIYKIDIQDNYKIIVSTN